MMTSRRSYSAAHAAAIIDQTATHDTDRPDTTEDDSIEHNVLLFRPTAAYLLRHAGPGVNALTDAPPGSARADWLDRAFWRESTMRWLRLHAKAYTGRGDERAAYDTAQRAHAAYQRGIIADLAAHGIAALRADQVIVSAATVRWWRDTYGLLQFDGALYRPLADVPPFVLDQTENWWQTLGPYPPAGAAKRGVGRPRTMFTPAQTTPLPFPPTPGALFIPAYAPVAVSLEGVLMFAERHTGVMTPRAKPPYVRTHSGGTVSVGGIVGTPLDTGEAERALADAYTLSSDVIAAFMLILAKWCDPANRRGPDNHVVVGVNEYCAVRGYEQHHKGGFRASKKDNARQHFQALNRVYVRHIIPAFLRTKNARLHPEQAASTFVEGQLAVVSTETTGRNGDQATAFRALPGAWINDLLADNPRYTAILFTNILRIRTGGQQRAGELAYRLGLYVTLNWRTKATHGNIDQTHVVRKLLASMGLDVDATTHHEERRRLRGYLETALDLLQEADVIGRRDATGTLIDPWAYATDRAKAPVDPQGADAPWDEWLRWAVSIPAPQVARDYYEAPRVAHLKKIEAEARTDTSARTRGRARAGRPRKGGET